MIVFVTGEVVHTGEDYIILQLGGVGLQVYVPVSLARQAQPGQTLFLHTYLVIREEGWSLYGFETETERQFFGLLLGVNGIGPRLALAILSVLPVALIQQAVRTEQPEIFTRVPGVGRKTAQKIVLYLQDKVGQAEALAPLASLSDIDHEVLEALTSLGYSVVEAQAALQFIPKDAPPEVGERLRLALQYFSS